MYWVAIGCPHSAYQNNDGIGGMELHFGPPVLSGWCGWQDVPGP